MTADQYLREVAFAIRDLPWRTKHDLLADLRHHLAELPPDTNLVAQLGSPVNYGAELRAAAGLERRRGSVAFLRARRPRNLVLTALGLTVVGLTIATAVWINSYKPLQTGNAAYAPGAHDSPTGDGIYYVFRQGKRFEYGMTIWNSGRFAVRIVAVPLQYGWPVKFRVLMSAPTSFNYGGIPRPYTPFHPFDLRPGDERGVVFSGAYDEPCWYRRRGLSEPRDAIPVRFKFLWHTKTVWIALPEKLTFVFTKASECARAKP